MALFKVPLMEDESLTSFTSRFAHANARTARELCQDFGFSFRSVIGGKDEAVAKLSEISGVSGSLLDAAAVKHAGKKTILVAGYPTPYSHYPRSIMKFCPACFTEDDGRHYIRPKVRRYMRKLWYSRAIRTCPVHDQSLVTAGSNGMADNVHDFCLALDGLRREIGIASRASVTQSFTPFETYIRTRLSGTLPGNNLLDPLPPFVAADICELAGLVLINGKQVAMKGLSERDLWSAADAGYELLASGNDGLHRLLGQLHESTSTIRALNGGYQLFGQFYKVIANSRLEPAYDPIKEAIRSYAYENLPLPDNVHLFGKSGSAKYLSYNSLGKQYDLSPIIIRKVLHNANRIQTIPGTDSEAVNIDDLPWLVELVSDLIRGSEAAQLIGASPKLFDALEKHGFVQQKIARDEESQLARRYSRKEVLALQEAILSRVNTTDLTGLISIESVCRSLSIKFGDVLRLIAEGDLGAIGLNPSRSGLTALMVVKREVATAIEVTGSTRRRLASDRGTRTAPGGLENWMSADELADHLCTNDKAISALLREGHIKTTIARNERNYPMKGANREDVRDFAERYVALAECVRRTEKHSRTVATILEHAGVTRAFSRDEMREVFLPRREAEAALGLTAGVRSVSEET